MRCITLFSLRRGCRRGRQVFGAEDGGLLIEVMISAVVVVLLALGVFKALDTASATSGAIKGRAIAAGLAQADLERMRGMKVTDLSNRRETNYRVQGGITFTVASRAEWVTDQSAPASCSSDSSRADYLKITSSVTWPAMGGIDPVILTSVQAAPVGSFKSDEGSLAVAVVDSAGNPVVGKQVSLSGPQGYTDVTNAFGCVLWGFLDQGNYTVTLSPGCTDRAGITPVTKPVSVVGEAVTTVELDCDVPGDIRATFETEKWFIPTSGVARWQLFTASTPRAAPTARHLSVGNSGLPAPFWRSFGNGTDQATITATLLYPFTEQYALYSGNCANADPRTAPNIGSATLQAAPRGGTAGPVKVREPAINVQAVNLTGGAALSGVRIKAYARTAGCPTGTYELGNTNAQGQVTYPGVPYGLYDVCAQRTSGSPAVTRRSPLLANQQAYRPQGTGFSPTGVFALPKIQVPTSGVAGTCP